MSDDGYGSDGGHPSWGRLGNPGKCSEDCIYKRFAANMQNAEARDKQMREEGAKAERERVLDDVAQYCQKYAFVDTRRAGKTVSLVPLIRFIQSLRPGQKETGK